MDHFMRFDALKKYRHCFIEYNPNKMYVMSTGISSLDDAIGGLENGKLYCIACSSLLNRLPLLAEVAIGM